MRTPLSWKSNTLSFAMIVHNALDYFLEFFAVVEEFKAVEENEQDKNL